MKFLPPTLEAARSQLRAELPWVWLYSFRVPTTPNTIYRLTNYTEQLTFDTSSAGVGLLWYPAPIVHSSIDANARAEIPTMTVSVGNVSREVGATIDTHGGLIGERVTIILLNIADLTNPTSSIPFEFKVVNSVVTQEAASFELSALDLYRRKTPNQRFLRRHCRFQFGGDRCGYVIPSGPGETVGTGFSTCGKLLDDCEERGADELARSVTVSHPERFGGFLGLPRQT